MDVALSSPCCRFAGYLLSFWTIPLLATAAMAQEAVPDSMTYAGREPDAAWRAEAEARIEQHRMAPLDVRVTDAEGQPVEGAVVQAAMQRHAFGFGTVVSVRAWADSSADGARYRQKLENLAGDGRSFNIAVIENALKWEPWEDGWAGTHEQTVEAVAWLREQGMDVRGHNLIWPAWKWLPEDLEARQNDPDYLRERIRDHIAEIASYPGLRGVLRDWDVLNEPVHLKDLENILGDTAYAEWFRLAAEADPEARLFINEYGILSDAALDYDDRQAYRDVIRQIEEDGGRIDGVGMQVHTGYPLAPPERVYAVLDTFATLGKPVAITEYDAAGVEEETAADYLRDFLTIIFSHSAVESFLMWGFWDGNHWLDDAPLFREDWSLKPSGQAFLDLVFDQWWTSAEGETAADGTWATRGFLGDYAITVTRGDETITQNVTLTPETEAIEVQLGGETSNEGTSESG